MATILKHNDRSLSSRSFTKLGRWYLCILFSILLIAIVFINFAVIPSTFLQSTKNEFFRNSIELTAMIENQFNEQSSLQEPDLTNSINTILSQYDYSSNLAKLKIINNSGLIIYSKHKSEIGHNTTTNNLHYNKPITNISTGKPNAKTISENIVPLFVNNQKIGIVIIHYDITNALNITKTLITKTQAIFVIIFSALILLSSLAAYYLYHNQKSQSRSEHLLKLMANNAKDIVFKIRLLPTINVDFVSPAVTDITGYRPDEFYDNPDLFFSLGSPDSQNLLKTIADGSFDFTNSITLRCFNKEFTLLYIELQVLPIYNSKNEIIAIEGIARDITEKHQMMENLHYLSLHDPLTGLYNRVFFEKELTKYDDDENKVSIAVVICDIDGLKLTNDTFGHKAGDTLLLEAAKIIKTSFPNTAIVARTGGDEFTILIKDTNKRKVQEYQSIMLLKVEEFNQTNLMLPLSISSGMALRTDSSIKMRTLYRLAGNIMYRGKLQQSQSTRSSIVQILKKALEARDFVTEGHATRLIKLVSIIANQLESVDLNVNDLTLFAQFHDIGKVGIPDRILFKQGPLNSEEKQEMQRHSEIGYKIALTTPELTPIANLILKHHEWWNGKGYPLGLKGNDIPLESRILAIADAFDAMTSDRPYRKALNKEAALTELRNYSGVQFDSYLVDIFINAMQPNNNSKPIPYDDETAASNNP